MTEEWRPVLGWEGFYEVSDQGRVRALDRVVIRKDMGKPWRYKGRICSQRVGWTPYYAVSLTYHNRKETRLVHHLVCEAFHGPRGDGQVARHLNDVKLDNRAENLAWGSKTDNRRDAVRNGRDYWTSRTHCKFGHEYTPETTRFNRSGARLCLICSRIASREKRARKRAMRPPVECGMTTATGRPCRRMRPDPDTPCFRHLEPELTTAAARQQAA